MSPLNSYNRVKQRLNDGERLYWADLHRCMSIQQFKLSVNFRAKHDISIARVVTLEDFNKFIKYSYGRIL